MKAKPVRINLIKILWNHRHIELIFQRQTACISGILNSDKFERKIIEQTQMKYALHAVCIHWERIQIRPWKWNCNIKLWFPVNVRTYFLHKIRCFVIMSIQFMHDGSERVKFYIHVKYLRYLFLSIGRFFYNGCWKIEHNPLVYMCVLT